MNSQPSERAAVVGVVDPQALQDNTFGTDAVDMSKFHDAMFVIMAGSIPSSGSLGFKLQESVNGSTGWADITGKAITSLADTQDNKQAVINVKSDEISAGYRYVRGLITASDHANVGAAIALGMSPRFGPASDDDHADVVQIVS